MTKVGRLIEEEAVQRRNREIARSLLDVLQIEVIAEKTGLSIDEVKEIEGESKTQEGSEEE